MNASDVEYLNQSHDSRLSQSNSSLHSYYIADKLDPNTQKDLSPNQNQVESNQLKLYHRKSKSDIQLSNRNRAPISQITAAKQHHPANIRHDFGNNALFHKQKNEPFVDRVNRMPISKSFDNITKEDRPRTPERPPKTYKTSPPTGKYVNTELRETNLDDEVNFMLL